MIAIKSLLEPFWNAVTALSAIAVFAFIILAKASGFNDDLTRLLPIAALIGAVYTFHKGYQALTYGLSIGLLGALFLKLGVNILESYRILKEWDFLSFYFFGALGASGGNFYDPGHSMAVFQDLLIQDYVGNNFPETIANVGFWYPPPTMFLLVILGYFPVETSEIIWKTFVLVTLALSMTVTVKYFWEEKRSTALLLILIALFLSHSKVYSTIDISQTNFLLLALLMLTLKYLNTWKSGIFLGLAVIVKPIAVIWAGYFLFSKRFKSLMAMAATGLVISLAAVAVFGFEQFYGYFTSPPTDRMPSYLFDEAINKSLNANLIRNADHLDFLTSYPQGIKLLNICLSLVLVVLTAFFSTKIEKRDPALAFLLFIPTSLLIYPGSLEHYSVLLIPFFFYCLLRMRDQLLLLVFLGLALLGLYYFIFGLYLVCIATIFASVIFPVFKFPTPEEAFEVKAPAIVHQK